MRFLTGGLELPSEEGLGLIRGADSQEVPPQATRQTNAELSLALEDLTLSTAQGLADLKTLISLEIEELSRGPRFAYKPGAEVYHAVASAHPLMTREHHETRCGWSFGMAPNARRYDVEPKGLQIRRNG